MKVKLLAVFLVVIFAGCATIQYDPQTGVFTYQRFGNQELIGLHVEKNLSGVTVELGNQKSDREIGEVLLSISKNIDKALEILNELQKKFPGLF